MKSVLKTKSEKAEEKYPHLGISITDKQIVLFYGSKRGMIVHGGNTPRPIGILSNTWDMDCFIPYTGEVTLSND